MKKLILMVIISLNLSFPANAVLQSGDPNGNSALYMISGTLMVIVGAGTGMPSLAIIGLLFDGNQNSDKILAQVEIDSDIDRMVSIGIYSESEAENLKTELAEFEASGKSLTVDGTQLKDKSPEEVVSAIQSEAEVSRLTAEYLAHKIGVQIQ